MKMFLKNLFRILVVVTKIKCIVARYVVQSILYTNSLAVDLPEAVLFVVKLK